MYSKKKLFNKTRHFIVIIILVLLFAGVSSAITNTYSMATICSAESNLFQKMDQDNNEIIEVVVAGKPPDIKVIAVNTPEPNIALGTNLLS
ncbi:MAG: hypothetical protein NTV30_01525, partial [Chloroflexi bacterium]|nr:hypothetical protein [Chloroflexota bacterium]